MPCPNYDLDVSLQVSTLQGLLVSYYPSIVCQRLKEEPNTRAYMRGTAVLLPAKYKFKQIYPLTRSWGNYPTIF